MFVKVLCFVVLLKCVVAVGESQNQATTRQRYSGYNVNNVNQNDYISKIFGTVTGLQSSSHDINQKLDEIDNKVSRIDSETRNGFASLKNVVGHETPSATLNHVKREIEAMRLDLMSTTHKRQADASSSEPDCSEKLTAIATLLTSTRSAIAGIQRDFMSFSTNMSQLLALSSDIHKRQHLLPTKQYLNNVVHATTSPHQRIPPVYGILNNPPRLGSSCFHISQLSSSVTGDIEIQRIQVPTIPEPFFVLCDHETQDGGWTVVQQRIDGTINFNRNWLEYKNGFGNIAGEFFIGLDKLHAMTTSALCELLIVMEDFENNTRYAKYSAFAIAGEREDYAMNLLGGYDGTAGDSLSFSASYKFSTFDNDNDGWVEGNCAQAHTGAWWFNACEMRFVCFTVFIVKYLMNSISAI
ncbi:hypothetical protein ACFFRR_011821 [Megaselia abdita]